MSSLLDVAKQFFESDNWHYRDVPEMGILTMNFKGNAGQWVCFVQARDEHGLLALYSIAPITAPDDRRQAMCEYLARANYNMAVGNFEMDMADGQIRYKTSIAAMPGELTASLIGHMVYANLLNMDKYLPGIQAVIEVGVSPAEAIAQIEGQA
jgi:hypothetical protein